MKRRLILTVVLGLLSIFLLSACGKSDEETTENAPQPDPENTTEQATGNEKDVETVITETSSGKILVAYFSATGNTKPLAEYAAEILAADLYEIVPEELYTEDDLNYADMLPRFFF